MTEATILTDTLEETSILFGSYDCNITPIEKAFGMTVLSKDTMASGGSAVLVRGEDADMVEKAAETVRYALRMVKTNGALTEQNVDYVISMVDDGKKEELHALDGDCICITTRGKPIKAKTVGQMQYIEAIKKNTVILGVGPAGTGKTFLAVAMAVKALRNKECSRIILTRPAVEAGEKLGFLRATYRRRSTRICVRSTTRCMKCSVRRRIRSIWNAERSKSRRSRICADGRSTIPSSFWMKRRTRRPSR